jgi:uncharacterized protein (DUF427 family)
VDDPQVDRHPELVSKFDDPRQNDIGIGASKRPVEIDNQVHHHLPLSSKPAEANHPPVVYLPRVDIDMSAHERTARVTTCAYKDYYSIGDGTARDDNAVWTYELPKTEIGSHLAFIPTWWRLSEADEVHCARPLKRSARRAR